MSIARELLPPIVYRSFKSLRKRDRPGLNGLDSRLERYLDLNREGYFVEIGANDGYTQSNTWFLEKEYGWRGVLVEPCAAEFVQLLQNRSQRNHFICAAGVDFDFPDNCIMMRYSGLMTVAIGPTDLPDGHLAHADDGRRFLPYGVHPFDFAAIARTLQSILDEFESPSWIDLLSLDVEGAELLVLRGIDHTRTRFGHLLVESRSPKVLYDYLSRHGYEMVDQLSHHDFLYRNFQT